MTSEPSSLRRLTPHDAAALLVSALEARGAVFEADADGYLHTDLNGCGPRPTTLLGLEPDALAAVILALADEITVMIRARAVQH